jgi:ketosteroid isomerase-like protein
MYKATVRRLMRRGVRALNSGDLGPLLASFSEDAVLTFPGQSSWAGEYRGKPAIEEFVRRFREAGLRGEVRDIVVNGPPWRMTVCALFVDRATGADGTTIYENRAMFLLRGKWGKVVSQEDFLDTQKVAAFDEARRAG